MIRPVGRQYNYPPAQYGQHPPANGPQGQQGQDGAQGQGQGGQYHQSRYMNSLQQQPQQQQQQYHPQQQQHQQQPQQQSLQQQGQNANGAGGSTGTGSAAGDAQSQANSGPAGQEMNLASVLHYLQSEWRRWERDRNEWEIERAEMRARIALLEGQRRSAENLKVDLLRRVKMLEYALRQERTKTVSTAGKSTIAPSRLSTLQDEDRSQREEKEGSGSEGSEEGSQDRPRANGVGSGSGIANANGHAAQPSAMSLMSTVGSRMSDSPWKSIGAVPKDPKARARSREYLKQCLQEITYLTSPGALNPLPPQPPISIDAIDQPRAGPTPADGQADPAVGGESSQAKAVVPERPRKILPDQPPPSTFASASSSGSSANQAAAPAPAEAETESTAGKANLPNGETGAGPSTSIASSSSAAPTSTDTTVSPKASTAEASSPSASSKPANPIAASLRGETADRPPSSPARGTLSLPELNTSQPEGNADEGEQQMLTAIYRPSSSVAWRDQLRAANERAEKASKRSRSESVTSSSAASSASAGEGSRRPSDEEQLQALTLNVVEEESADKVEEGSTEKSWTSRKVLRSHLDVVRAVTFAHGPGIMLASAGDDCVVKVWYMDAAAVMTPKSNTAEIEPILTFRTHTAPITALAIHNPLGTLFSASFDSSIIAWRLPTPTQDPYAPHDPASLLQVLEGHTDAVWDLCLVPSRAGPSSDDAAGMGTITANKKSALLAASSGQTAGAGTAAAGQRSLLVSASADGSIKIWNHSGAGWALKRTISFDGATPTCLGAYPVQGGKVLVGFTDGRVGLVDVESEGKDGEAVYFGEASDTNKQVNAVVCHSTWPAIFAGYEDGYIRIFNANTPDLPAKHEILAHPAPITSLALSPLHPHGLVSSATDCSIRVWDLNKRTSIQDCAGHRQRAGEGVTGLARHPELPVLASAGADGVVRVWSAT